MDWLRSLFVRLGNTDDVSLAPPAHSIYDYFIQASGTLADAQADADEYAAALGHLTRFAAIRDPLHHIIRGMIGPQPVMRASIYTVYEYVGRFYFEERDDVAMTLQGTKWRIQGDGVVDPNGTQYAVRYRPGICRLDDGRWFESYMRASVLLHRK